MSEEKGTGGTITLPEITIVGDPNAQPQNASDWWATGFVKGYNAPEAAAERPLMINDELAAAFLTGFQTGQEANREMQADFEERFRDSPQIGPDLGGEALDEVQRRYQEAWEALLHKHPPHIETPTEEGPPEIEIAP